MKKKMLVFLGAVLVAVPILAWVAAIGPAESANFAVRQFSWLAGSVGFVVLFIQFALSSRVKSLEIDVGLDRMIHVHRITGIVGVSLIFLHLAALTLYELLRFGVLSLSLLKASGAIAFLVMLVVSFAALFYKRLGWRYESWKRVHFASYVVFPIVFIHSMYQSERMVLDGFVMQAYWWVLLAIWAAIVLYKVVIAIRVRSRPHTVTGVTPVSHDVTTVTFAGPALRHRPGQFMLVSVAMGDRVEPSHPYTIASSPRSDTLQISAKAVGDFSSALPDLQPGSRAFIEGPYGVFSFLNYDSLSLVFIAGGIGITPFMSQLRYLRDTTLSRKVRLIWGNKTEEDLCFTDELEAMKRELSDFDFVHVMSHQDDWPGERGFITRELVERHVHDKDDATFFVCGPPVMMEKVIPMLGREMAIPGDRIRYERFALG